MEMGADAVDIDKTIHPHPTLAESIDMAAEVAHDSDTNLPPVRKQSDGWKCCCFSRWPCSLRGG